MIGRRPRATVKDCVLVEISARTAEDRRDRRWLDDDGTLHGFREWMRHADVYPVRGLGCSGPGYFIGVFTGPNAGRVRQWLSDGRVVPVTVHHESPRHL